MPENYTSAAQRTLTFTLKRMKEWPSLGFVFSGVVIHMLTSTALHFGSRSVFVPHVRVRTPLCPLQYR